MKNIIKWFIILIVIVVIWYFVLNKVNLWDNNISGIDISSVKSTVDTSFAATSVINTSVKTNTTKKTDTITDTGSLWNKIGNTFEKAKTKLEKSIYNDKVLSRVEIYCGCKYNAIKKTVDCKFKPTTKSDRWIRVEWEHVVPAENFWQAFTEWRDWDKKLCWKTKWRECAKKNPDFARMEWDMYNLYPANGELNWLRSNRKYGELDSNSSTVKKFQGCTAQIDYTVDQFEPPEVMKGELARVNLYFDYVYTKYSLSDQQKTMFLTWSKEHPVTDSECNRYKAIKNIQWTDNPILAKLCK